MFRGLLVLVIKYDVGFSELMLTCADSKYKLQQSLTHFDTYRCIFVEYEERKKLLCIIGQRTELHVPVRSAVI